MKSFLKQLYDKHSSTIIAILIGLIVVMAIHFKYKLENNGKVDEIEFKDSTNTYNKIYYESKISELKNKNKELYDSLKDSKDKIDYLIQFTSTQSYNTGKVVIKKEYVKDTVYIDSIKGCKTFEYTNVNPNDTMIYNLKINSSEEPNWYSLNIKTNTKYTIINKEYENGMNHITIGGNDLNADISNVTVFKKKKSFLDKFSIGPSITTGYDVINKQWGIMAGASITYNF